MRIIVQYMGMTKKNYRHAQTVMAELGIKYKTATPQTMGDCWWFDGVDPATVPATLPDYVVISEAGP